MHSFVDGAGRTWTLSLNLGAVKRVHGLAGINLVALSDGDPPLLTRLGTEVILLCDVIFALLKPQADAAGVSDEEFGASLGGDAILAAQQAFYEELTDFFLSLGRSDLAKALIKQKGMIDAAVAEVDRRLEIIDPETEIRLAFGGPSTNSPASAESPPSP